MIKEWIVRAENGESVWLPVLREAFAKDPSAGRWMVRLKGSHYGVRDYEIFLPHGKGEAGDEAAERGFLLRYLKATIYNLLSAFSAGEVVLYYGEDDPGAESLAQELPECFMREKGLGKVRHIARRIYGDFCFRTAPMREYQAVPDTEKAEQIRCGGTAETETAETLSALLKRRIPMAEMKNCVGIDIGGSDIKLAVSAGGKLLYTREYDWNPASSPTAEGIIEPVLDLLREAQDRLVRMGGEIQAVGISFPDIVIDDEIVGGETPKTKGMRDNPDLDYETEFMKLRNLRESVLPLCAPGASVRITNDGNMAAFTAAMEMAVCDNDSGLSGGIIAHTLGTDLGTGWLKEDCTIPAIPLEMYDLLLDLGDLPSASLPPEDLRSIRNENSGMPGVRRYLGQAAAYRLAWKLDAQLLKDYVKEEGGVLRIPTEPADLRKPCLEHLMQCAADNEKAGEIFRQIGRNLAMVACEMNWIFGTTPPARFLFGRFTKSRRCFELIREGFEAAYGEFLRSGKGQAEKGSALEEEGAIQLVAADESMANTPLMCQLAESKGVTVAQFGQAVGAIYYALDE